MGKRERSGCHGVNNGADKAGEVEVVEQKEGGEKHYDGEEHERIGNPPVAGPSAAVRLRREGLFQEVGDGSVRLSLLPDVLFVRQVAVPECGRLAR